MLVDTGGGGWSWKRMTHLSSSRMPVFAVLRVVADVAVGGGAWFTLPSVMPLYHHGKETRVALMSMSIMYPVACRS